MGHLLLVLNQKLFIMAHQLPVLNEKTLIMEHRFTALNESRTTVFKVVSLSNFRRQHTDGQTERFQLNW